MRMRNRLVAAVVCLWAVLLAGADAAQARTPDYSGAWKFVGTGRQAKLILEQDGTKLTGYFESSDGSQVWNVVGGIAADGSIRMTRYIPISELGNTPEPALSSAFEAYGATDRLGFLRGKVTLRPSGSGLSGSYTRINVQFYSGSGKVHKIEEVDTPIELVRAKLLPDLKVENMTVAASTGGPTGGYWEVSAEIVNGGGQAPTGRVALRLERTNRVTEGREPEWEPVAFSRFEIASLAPGGKVKAMWSENAAVPGAPLPIHVTPDDQALRIVIDPDNQYDEQSKRNNREARHRVSCDNAVEPGTPRNRIAWIDARPASRTGTAAFPARYASLLKGPGDKTATMLCIIKMEAQTRARRGGMTVAGTKFLDVLTKHLLRGYLRLPNPATGVLTITELGDTQGAPRLGLGAALYVPEGLRARYPGTVAETREWLYPATQFFIIGSFVGRHVKMLPYIDAPFLVGDANTSTAEDADFLGGGKNLSNVMHWGTGLKYYDMPRDAMRELFSGYEYWHMEGFDIFGEDALNDLIAEETGRMLGARIARGGIRSAADLGRKLDMDFRAARAWVGALIRERQDVFDEMIQGLSKPKSDLWFGWQGRKPITMAPWGTPTQGSTIRAMLLNGMAPMKVAASHHVEHLIQIYTLIYESWEWEKAHGSVGLTNVMRRVVHGDYNDQFRAAPKDWGARWDWRP